MGRIIIEQSPAPGCHTLNFNSLSYEKGVYIHDDERHSRDSLGLLDRPGQRRPLRLLNPTVRTSGHCPGVHRQILSRSKNFPYRPRRLCHSHGLRGDVTDGAEVEFDATGLWTDVSAPKGKAIPTGIVLPAIDQYVSGYYPGAAINEIERIIPSGYEVDLTNRLELIFTQDGTFISSYD
ncbi:MAG: PepSY-like domain-containing protein [Duncaniella sp.]|nr:PepSY-like domain-containing protein [Duncaniella sp.]